MDVMAASGHAQLHDLRKGDALMSDRNRIDRYGEARLARRLDRDRTVRQASAGLLGRRHPRRRRQGPARHHHRRARIPSWSGSACTSGAGSGSVSAATAASTSASPPSGTGRISTCPTSCPNRSELQIRDWKGCDGVYIEKYVRCRRRRSPPDHCGTLYQVGAKFELRCCGCCEDEDSHLAVAGHEPRASTCSTRPDRGPLRRAHRAQARPAEDDERSVRCLTI